MKNGPYELVIAPKEYPGKKYRGRYCYEHHLVWWQNYGKTLPLKYVIHHLNDNKRDNQIENLQMMSKIEHTKHHSVKPVMVTLRCNFCGVVFQRERRKTNSKNQIYFYCGRSCQVRAQWRERKKLK